MVDMFHRKRNLTILTVYTKLIIKKIPECFSMCSGNITQSDLYLPGEYAHGKKQQSYSLLFNPYIDCHKHDFHYASGSYVCTK